MTSILIKKKRGGGAVSILTCQGGAEVKCLRTTVITYHKASIVLPMHYKYISFFNRSAENELSDRNVSRDEQNASSVTLKGRVHCSTWSDHEQSGYILRDLFNLRFM
jgi:hypothetical protein